MSDKFFNIGRSIFNKDHVVAITEESALEGGSDTGKIFACVTLAGDVEPIRVELPDGQSLGDVVDSDALNY